MNTYSETDANYSVGTLSAFVVGAAVGAAAALILAPVSGRDTRAYLKRRGNELGHDAMERGKEQWRSQSERMKSAMATGWDRAGDAIQHARQQGEAAYREARESFGETRHSVTDSSVGRAGYRPEPPRSAE
jgi:gas vesicle protein